MIKRISTVLIGFLIITLNLSSVFAGDYDRIFIQKWGTSSEAYAESPARTAGGSNHYENVISKLNQPRSGGTTPHIGTDLQMHAGTDVYPIFKGKVTAVKHSTYGQLAYVTLQSDTDGDGSYDNEYIRYLHIDPKDTVAIGDIFDTDESFGKIDIDRRSLPGGGYNPHLHIERNNQYGLHQCFYTFYRSVSAWLYGFDWDFPGGGDYFNSSQNELFITGYSITDIDANNNKRYWNSSFRIYYKINSGNWNSTPVYASQYSSGTYRWKYDFDDLPGVSSGDYVYYYIAGIRATDPLFPSSVTYRHGLWQMYYKHPAEKPADIISGGGSPKYRYFRLQ